MNIPKIHAMAVEMDPWDRYNWILNAVDVARERCLGVLKVDGVDAETELLARNVLSKLRELKL